ncbi:MAG TPA: hypothetical protein PKE49_18020 [Leptospiraceae bacterium]|mgnify:FL=1|jgi:hypothetical protein|nr:hypothetical protein [Leptospirales bacterium]HMU81763.1 hypothetical protein [Leptospiraceae bacterium]HMW61308.1 hypothetical protein [Leptospiraceae bacterium]HMX58429.1 hypothetical protein [Leptospiraceae bacterium]HMY47407.1 hypothetical protein [Leptospiraceae bacterium]
MRSIVFAVLVAIIAPLMAQTKANDIPVEKLPADVKQVLEQYVNILRTSKSLDECATRFTSIAGGSLVTDEKGTLRDTVKPFSLKKDFNDIKQYADPIVITRVNATPSNGQGYGSSAIKGMVYKIWIAKKDASIGMPAPVSILVPEGHPTITTPKVVGIGSY